MNLSFNDIKNITVGAVSITESEDGIRFARCTEKQIATWASESDFLGNGARATTGIKLDLVTDSPFIEFSASSGNRFEIHVDGMLRRVLFMNEYRERGEVAHVPVTDPFGRPFASGERHRVTLLFPCHEVGVINHVSVEDGATVEPYQHSTRILFIGDSITQGWDSGYISMAYTQRVEDFFDAESINQGIGGSFFNADAFDNLNFDPDFTVVAYGTNDWGKRGSTEDLFNHAKAHLSLIKNAFGGGDKKIFAISPIWRDEPKPRAMGSFSDCRGAVIKAINEVGVIHIDGLSLVPPCPELFADKNLHPNALGFSFYSENLIGHILKHL